MKKMVSKSIAVLAVAFALLSFSSPFGGEGFEISVNGKVVLQKYGKNINDAQTINLSDNSLNDKLTIRYYHCGKVAKNRFITIKDGEDNAIKVWRFKDAETATGDMSCSVKDVLSLSKGGNTIFKIYYASSELPEGRMLTKLVFNHSSLAARK